MEVPRLLGVVDIGTTFNPGSLKASRNKSISKTRLEYGKRIERRWNQKTSIQLDVLRKIRKIEFIVSVELTICLIHFDDNIKHFTDNLL